MPDLTPEQIEAAVKAIKRIMPIDPDEGSTVVKIYGAQGVLTWGDPDVIAKYLPLCVPKGERP